ncbi:hypothetical protein VTL71DRAFT_9493 [Oculimacula yallundae]|uniref:Uncharacterized protein n=1 Tax=Oculimacula yallundae TaxID=86028 RepID=A0ABR4BS20_9HELO
MSDLFRGRPIYNLCTSRISWIEFETQCMQDFLSSVQVELNTLHLVFDTLLLDPLLQKLDWNEVLDRTNSSGQTVKEIMLPKLTRKLETLWKARTGKAIAKSRPERHILKENVKSISTSPNLLKRQHKRKSMAMSNPALVQAMLRDIHVIISVIQFVLTSITGMEREDVSIKAPLHRHLHSQMKFVLEALRSIFKLNPATARDPVSAPVEAAIQSTFSQLFRLSNFHHILPSLMLTAAKFIINLSGFIILAIRSTFSQLFSSQTSTTSSLP